MFDNDNELYPWIWRPLHPVKINWYSSWVFQSLSIDFSTPRILPAGENANKMGLFDRPTEASVGHHSGCTSSISPWWVCPLGSTTSSWLEEIAIASAWFGSQDENPKICSHLPNAVTNWCILMHDASDCTILTYTKKGGQKSVREVSTSSMWPIDSVSPIKPSDLICWFCINKCCFGRTFLWNLRYLRQEIVLPKEIRPVVWVPAYLDLVMSMYKAPEVTSSSNAELWLMVERKC